MADLDELAASLRSAVQSIESAQSSGSLTIDRGGEAIRILGAVTDGSANDHVANAYAALAEANDQVETAIANLVIAKDEVMAYAAGRGLAVGGS